MLSKIYHFIVFQILVTVSVPLEGEEFQIDHCLRETNTVDTANGDEHEDTSHTHYFELECEDIRFERH